MTTIGSSRIRVAGVCRRLLAFVWGLILRFLVSDIAVVGNLPFLGMEREYVTANPYTKVNEDCCGEELQNNGPFTAHEEFEPY